MKRIITAFVMAIIFVSGCKKKPIETVPDKAPPLASPSPKPGVTSGSGTSPTDSGGGSPSGGGGGGGSSGGGGGFAAVQNIRQAARRTQALNELKNLGELIEGMRDPIGKMPTKDQIQEALKRD